jgi:hypothetical protein
MAGHQPTDNETWLRQLTVTGAMYTDYGNMNFTLPVDEFLRVTDTREPKGKTLLFNLYKENMGIPKAVKVMDFIKELIMWRAERSAIMSEGNS